MPIEWCLFLNDFYRKACIFEDSINMYFKIHIVLATN